MEKIEEIKNGLRENQYTWLITGVAGFIGSNLLEALLKLNQKVVGIDNFATGYKHNLEDVLNCVDAEQKKNFIFYEGDIYQLEDCKKVVKGVDYVLHQAALGSIPRSINTPELTNQTNVSGFLHMLMAAKDANIKRFVFASSSSVYGDSVDLPKVETHIGNPLSPYAVSKYTNELYAKAFANCYQLNTIGLRYFNIFGPRQNTKGPYAAVIPLWITSLLKGDAIKINGDGETSRDFCFVENAIQANLLAAKSTNSEALNKIYNITVGQQTTLNKLYEMIASKLSISPIKPTYLEFRNGDIRHSLADITRAKTLLGYNPQFTVEKGLSKTVEWFSSKKDLSLF